MPPKTKDLGTGLGVALAGGALIMLALRARWSPQGLNPGIEGCLTATLVGFGLLLLHPMPYARALALSVPTTAALYLSCAYAGGQGTGLGMAGIQLLVMGATGIVLSLREQGATTDAGASETGATDAGASEAVNATRRGPSRRAAASHA